MLKQIPNMSYRLVVTLAVTAALTQGAWAQMFEQPYRNRTTDRAGMAIFMKQIDMGLFNRNASTIGSGSGSSNSILVCGGPDGGSTATSNSSCIILGDGASGLINLGQASDGNQDAQTTQTQTTNNMSDALSTLTP